MKKSIIRVSTIIGIAALTLGMNVRNVKADEANSTYYVNLNGVKFTKEQYTEINNYFDEDIIAAMDYNMAKTLKGDGEIKVVDSECIYVACDERTDSKGKIIDTIERVIPESQAKEMLNKNSVSTYSLSDEATHTTAMKKITLTGYVKGGSTRYAQITNEWLSLPKIKAYDIIALRPGSTSATISPESIVATQTCDGTDVIKYSSTGDHVRKYSGGIGVSMNLKDAAKKTIKNSLAVTFVSGKSNFKVYGTYQHATVSISLKNSKKYKIDKSGYGKVLLFDEKIRDKYDNTAGVSIDLSF